MAKVGRPRKETRGKKRTARPKMETARRRANRGYQKYLKGELTERQLCLDLAHYVSILRMRLKYNPHHKTMISNLQLWEDRMAKAKKKATTKKTDKYFKSPVKDFGFSTKHLYDVCKMLEKQGASHPQFTLMDTEKVEKIGKNNAFTPMVKLPNNKTLCIYNHALPKEEDSNE